MNRQAWRKHKPRSKDVRGENRRKVTKYSERKRLDGNVCDNNRDPNSRLVVIQPHLNKAHRCRKAGKKACKPDQSFWSGSLARVMQTHRCQGQPRLGFGSRRCGPAALRWAPLGAGETGGSWSESGESECYAWSSKSFANICLISRIRAGD